MFALEESLHTERLVLRPFEMHDLDDLHAIFSRSDVVRYLYGDVLTRPEVAELLTKRMTQTSVEHDDDALRLAVERRTDSRVIGEVTLWVRSAQHQQGELGYVFHPDAHGNGFAHEAATAVLDVAFDRVGLHRVFARTDSRNVASAAVMRRLGMRQEAHLRHNELFKGDWSDELIFAVLEQDWSGSTSGQGPQ